jgi:hypothetical protein
MKICMSISCMYLSTINACPAGLMYFSLYLLIFTHYLVTEILFTFVIESSCNLLLQKYIHRTPKKHSLRISIILEFTHTG